MVFLGFPRNAIYFSNCLGLKRPDRKWYASELETLQAIESSGQLNPVQRTRLEELRGTGSFGTATGEAGAPGTFLTPEQRADQTLEGAYRNLQTEASQRFKQFQQAKGPFRLDEVLVAKRSEAAEQIDPYYNETLSDYLLGVQRKVQRSKADTRDLLGELQATTESFTGSTKLKLDEALNRAREGFAEAGLFESGRRFREEGFLERETGDVLGEFGRRQALKERGLTSGLERTLEDVGLQRKMQERDIGRERFTAVETKAGELARQAGQRYVGEFAQTLPPELQANTNFDLLKQIGIY